MACQCQPAPVKPDGRFRTALWIALIINLLMFVVELFGGMYAHSAALWADALDFFGDAANYAISLAVLGMSLYWRATVALLKALPWPRLAVWCWPKRSITICRVFPGSDYHGGSGGLALVANVVAAVILYRFRDGDSNMKSVWLCSRNDAIGNVAVILAAVGVFGTGSLLPDIIVAVIMAGLGLTAGYQVIKKPGRRDR